MGRAHSCFAPLFGSKALLNAEEQKCYNSEGEWIAPPPVKATRKDEARCEILDSEPLLGQNKWLGGVASFCGRYVYGVPGVAKRTLRINCETGKVDQVGPTFPGEYKWLRGAECEVDECLYCMPSNANSVLCIDPKKDEVLTFGGPFEGDWLWHGGNVGRDGMIYAIPANASQVLKIDPKTKEVSLFGGPWPQRQKWYGGIMSEYNGCIYGMPQCASGVLKINPATQEATIIGELGDGGWKFHGGLAAGDGSIIYGVPCNANGVLKIDTKTDTVSIIGRNLKSGRHRDDDKYKYLGGGLGGDGKVYFFPSDAERVLCLDPATDECKYVGPTFLEGMNKWQNGFLCRDGSVYAIPQRSPGVLKITPPIDGSDGDAVVSTLFCGEEELLMKDKYEGGVMGVDGNIYCIPLRAKRVCKIIPGPALPSRRS